MYVKASFPPTAVIAAQSLFRRRAVRLPRLALIWAQMLLPQSMSLILGGTKSVYGRFLLSPYATAVVSSQHFGRTATRVFKIGVLLYDERMFNGSFYAQRKEDGSLSAWKFLLPDNAS